MKQIIKSHCRRLLRNDTNVDDCKCLKKNKLKCPLPAKCNTKNLIYKANVNSDTNVKILIRSKGKSFENRWYGHWSYFIFEKSKCIPVNLSAIVLLGVTLLIGVTVTSFEP